MANNDNVQRFEVWLDVPGQGRTRLGKSIVWDENHREAILQSVRDAVANSVAAHPGCRIVAATPGLLPDQNLPERPPLEAQH